MIKSYVLNDFLKFERKIYNLLGINLGRAVSLKTLMWFVAITGAVFTLSALPVIGSLFTWIPFLPRLFFCGVATWLITDVGTENRSPLRFFGSFLRFHFHQLKQESYFQGRVLQKQKPMKFDRLPEIRNTQGAEPTEPEAIRFTGFIVR